MQPSAYRSVAAPSRCRAPARATSTPASRPASRRSSGSHRCARPAPGQSRWSPPGRSRARRGCSPASGRGARRPSHARRRAPSRRTPRTTLPLRARAASAPNVVSARLRPSTNSITRNACSPSSTKSCTRTMCSFASPASVLASRSNLRRCCPSDATIGLSSLIATSRPSVRSCARQTTPMPPSPSRSSSLYRPTSVVMGSDPVTTFTPPPVRFAANSMRGAESTVDHAQV